MRRFNKKKKASTLQRLSSKGTDNGTQFMKQLLERTEQETLAVQPEVRDSHSMFLSKTSRNDAELGRLLNKISECSREESRTFNRQPKGYISSKPPAAPPAPSILTSLIPSRSFAELENSTGAKHQKLPLSEIGAAGGFLPPAQV